MIAARFVLFVISMYPVTADELTDSSSQGTLSDPATTNSNVLDFSGPSAGSPIVVSSESNVYEKPEVCCLLMSGHNLFTHTFSQAESSQRPIIVNEASMDVLHPSASSDIAPASNVASLEPGARVMVSRIHMYAPLDR